MNKIFKKLETKLSLYFFIISMAIVIVLSAVQYSFTQNVLMTSLKNRTERELGNASTYISSYIENIKKLTKLIAMTPEIESIDINEETKTDTIRNIIDITKENDPVISRIMIVSKNGQIISTDETNLETSTDMNTVEWYTKLVNSNNMPIVTTLNYDGFTMGKMNRVISLANEIVNSSNETIGVAVVDLSYQFIEDYASSLNFGDNGYSFITTSEENLIFDSAQMDRDLMIDNEDYKKIIEDRMKDVGSGFVASHVYIPNTDWLLIGVSSTDEIHELNNQVIFNTLIWAVVILIFSVLLSIYTSKSITKPIRNLINKMKDVDENFSKLPPEKNAIEEIKELENEYNLLLAKIQKLTKDIEEKENSKRIFELKALQSQINPHFIYNTFETIIWLIEFEENEKAIEVIKSLGNMLRSTLNIDKDFISFKEELEHIKSYLDIQKIRYDDKFEYNITIPSNLYDLKVPKMILQPIVENSIYHGIKNIKEKGLISIESEIVDDTLLIYVKDNGNELSDKAENGTKLGGIGMKNVDQRIKILCGEEYGIQIYRDSDFTVVEYRLSLV